MWMVCHEGDEIIWMYGGIRITMRGDVRDRVDVCLTLPTGADLYFNDARLPPAALSGGEQVYQLSLQGDCAQARPPQR